jgi:hypothetical protein
MGVDLPYRRAARGQPPRVVVGAVNVRSRNAVLPVPGLETRFNTNTPAAV